MPAFAAMSVSAGAWKTEGDSRGRVIAGNSEETDRSRSGSRLQSDQADSSSGGITRRLLSLSRLAGGDDHAAHRCLVRRWW